MTAKHAPLPSPRPLLEARELRVGFGGITALDGVSFSVQAGEICGLIGPNGAGKTTLFNCVTRLYPCQGSITFEGEPLLDKPPHAMAALGIGRTFQNLAVFESLSVLQTVMLGGHCRSRAGYLASMLGRAAVKQETGRMRSEASEILSFCGLAPWADKRVDDLPFGTRKRVELARALMTRPRLLLLDEPAGGLNHQEIDELALLIGRARETFQTAVLLVEHHMGLVMRLCDRIIVLNFGRKLAEGSPAEIRDDAEVVRAYLGGPA